MSFNNRIRALYSLSVLSTSAFLLAKITRAEKDEANVRTQQPPSPRIAVVGGGIGGTSSAYFLRELFGEAAQIDVYEPGSIGGRVASILVGDRKYECGASIIHPRNKYMVQHAEKFGLKHRKDVTVLMGSYDGKEFVFEESSWGFITILKMLWQYGWRDLFGLQREVNKMLKSFDSIYDFQENGRCFTTVRDMMQAMGGDDFVRWTMSPADQVLREMKFSELFISQVVSLATRVNYGQEPNMEAFAGDSDKDNFVYKVFSTDVPTEKQMSQIFSSYSNDVYRAWLAYPYYRNVDIDTVAPFQLYPGLFYVNAIEWAASAMEMSAIGAKNSALLAKKHWSGGGEESVVLGSQKVEL